MYLLYWASYGHHSSEAVDQALATVDWEKGEAAPLDLSDAFFHPQTAFKLQVLRRWLELNISLEGSEANPIAEWIFMVVLARLTGHSQGYMSGYTLPPNQATTVARQRRINAKRGETPPERPQEQLGTDPVAARTATDLCWGVARSPNKRR